MGRPPANANRVATRTRILRAAEQAFAAQGQAARLADIAAAAGIRRPSLLYHFPTKQHLYDTVITSAFARLGEALRGGREREGVFHERFEAVTRAFVAFVAAHPEVSQLVVRELVAADGPLSPVLGEQIDTLLIAMTHWITTEGAEVIRSDLPVRHALLTIVSDVLLAGSAGGLQTPLWGTLDPDRTWVLARTLFFQGAPE